MPVTRELCEEERLDWFVNLLIFNTHMLIMNNEVTLMWKINVGNNK